MDWQLIENGNWKAMELAIMVEAGTCMREMDPMKKEKKKRTFWVSVWFFLWKPLMGILDAQVCAKQCWQCIKGQEQRAWMVAKCGGTLRISSTSCVCLFLGVGSILELTSRATQVKLKLHLIIKLWKVKYPVSLLVDYCIIYSYNYVYLHLLEWNQSWLWQ
jgi:hypothetical protein